MNKLILMLLMCVFTTATTSSLFAQTSSKTKSSTAKTEQPIKRYINNASTVKSVTKNTNTKKQRVNKVQPKNTPSKKSKVVPKAKNAKKD